MRNNLQKKMAPLSKYLAFMAKDVLVKVGAFELFDNKALLCNPVLYQT